MMTLHSMRASEAPAGDVSAINSALTHASEIAKIVERLSKNESAPLDSILAVCIPPFLASKEILIVFYP